MYPRSDAAPERTLLDILMHTIELYPSAPAIDDGEQILSYAQLGEHVHHLAARLWSMGVGAGDRIGVRVPSGSKDLYVAILGAIYSGAAYVPVDAEEPEERASTVWEEAEVCAVIGEDLDITVRPGVLMRGDGPVPGIHNDAWIIFTSGSTGKPKGVAITHRSAAAWADAEAQLYLQHQPLAPGDRVMAGLSVAFDASCEEMWLAWRSGACLVPAPRELVRSGADLGDWLIDRRITAVSTVPTLAALWPSEALANIRLLIFGGEALPAELAARLAGDRREVWNTYGPTEATVIACGARVGGGETAPIGLPLAGWDLAVVDADQQLVPWGAEGELIIGGVGLGRYLDEAKDAEKYAPMPTLGWDRAYRTGDIVRAEATGLLFIGRADEQVKLGGRRVELGEIDQTLVSLPGVAQAAAAVQQTPSGNKILAGYLVPEPDSDLNPSVLRDRLRELLPAQLVPTLAIVQSLPVKTSGKVDRKALPWPIAGDEEALGESLHGTEAWLGGLWRELLGPLALDSDSDFFALGGASVAAAQLVGALRTRYPDASIADIYAHPRLGQLAGHLDSFDDTHRENHSSRPTPWWTGLVQAPVIAGLYGIIGLRYVNGMALVCWVLFNIFGAQWVPNPPLLPLLVGWVVLYSLPFRMLFAVICARVLLAGVEPGIYPRGSGTHLRLWTVERVVTFCKLEPIMGTWLGTLYARALGNKIAEDVHLDAMPPVTGLATIGAHSSVEYEVDLAGHWLDGDALIIDSIHIGCGVRVGTRATLSPGAVLEDGVEVEPGAAVAGTLASGERYAGSPVEVVGAAGDFWPSESGTHRRGGPGAGLRILQSMSLAYLGLLPILCVIPGGFLSFWLIDRREDLVQVLWDLAAFAPVFILCTAASYLCLIAATVRLLARLLTPGFHRVQGLVGWAAWLSTQLLAKTLVSMYPLYASILTPWWMRMLGARVGASAEISTLETLPHLTVLGAQTFMADHSLGSHPRVRGGWIHLGETRVQDRSFVGNSGIVGPDTTVPRESLIAVLSSAPQHMPERSSWFGRPPMELPRPVDQSDNALTYDPPRSLLAARALVELFRFVPMLVTVWLALCTVWVLSEIYDRSNLGWTLLLSGPVLLASATAAAVIALIAKWALVGRFDSSQHPLWTSFIWRNELADVFSESLAVAGVVRMSLGTPMLNFWFRLLGTRIGRRVWCETWWLPEQDLISIGDGASINRGTVLQTHLFHDRIMRMEPVVIGDHATIAPNGIVLPGSRVNDSATVGPCSVVMRSEEVPENGRWWGNPIRVWS